MNKILRGKRAIVLDFDGVLLESTGIKTWAFGELYKEYGKEVQSKVVEYQKKNRGINRFEKFKYFHNHILGKQLRSNEINKLSKIFGDLVIEKLKKTQTTHFSRKVLSILEKEGFKLYCVSASPVDELIEIIEHKGLKRFFVKVYGGSASKEENFELLSSDTGIDFLDMIYIGDSEIDLISSKNKNIDFIGYGEIIPKWGKKQYWIQSWKDFIDSYETVAL